MRVFLIGLFIVAAVHAQSQPESTFVTICAGVQADNSGNTDASGAIQACINAKYGSVFEIPAGIYAIAHGLIVNRPITIRTVGLQGALSCSNAAVSCATLRATADLYSFGGIWQVSGSNIVIDHIVIDGNRGVRTASQAAAECLKGNSAVGFNGIANCNNCSFLGSVSKAALCGTGFQWEGANCVFKDSSFLFNGNHFDSHWADGLTLLSGPSVLIQSCQFIDNSDVNLIIGNSPNGRVAYNEISMQPGFASFAGFMMDNFNGNQAGNFNGFVFANNNVNCGNSQCNYAVEVGPHPWYKSANIYGGTITQNTIAGGGVGINVYGGGIPSAPINIYGNDLHNVPVSHQFTCKVMPGSIFNVDADSYVNRNGETFTVTHYDYICP